MRVGASLCRQPDRKYRLHSRLDNSKAALTDLVALKAVFLVSSALQAVFGLDAFPVRTCILVVKNFPM